MFHKILTIAALAITFNSPADAGIFNSIKSKIAPSKSSNSGGGSTSMNPVDWTEIKNAIMKGDNTLICKEGGICRKLKGVGCGVSKDWFSTCAVICGNSNGFIGSTCAKNAGSHFGFNTRSYTYKTGERVDDHLQRQLEKGPKGQSNSIQSTFFTAFCTANGARFVSQNFKNKIQAGCHAYQTGGIEVLNANNQQMQQPVATSRPAVNQNSRPQQKANQISGNRPTMNQPQRGNNQPPVRGQQQMRPQNQNQGYNRQQSSNTVNQSETAQKLRQTKQSLNKVNPEIYAPNQAEGNDYPDDLYQDNNDAYDDQNSGNQYDQGYNDQEDSQGYDDQNSGDQYGQENNGQDDSQDYGDQGYDDQYDNQGYDGQEGGEEYDNSYGNDDQMVGAY